MRIAMIGALVALGTVAGAEGWTLDETSDAMDDTRMVTVSTESVDATCRGSRATLYLGCFGGDTRMIVHHGCYAPADNRAGSRIETLWRLGDAQARERSQEVDQSANAFGEWTRAHMQIHPLLGEDRLAIRFTPFQSNPVTMEFDISGIDEAIAPVREACGW